MNDKDLICELCDSEVRVDNITLLDGDIVCHDCIRGMITKLQDRISFLQKCVD